MSGKKKRMPDVTVPVFMEGHDPTRVLEMSTLFSMVLTAVVAGTAKGMGTLEGDMEWEYGDDTLSRMVQACGLFEHHSAALLTFAGAVHAAAFVLAEDVEGARTAGAVELGRGH